MRNLLISLFVLAALAGCNTVKGIGEDIEALGSGTQKTAEETKRKM